MTTKYAYLKEGTTLVGAFRMDGTTKVVDSDLASYVVMINTYSSETTVALGYDVYYVTKDNIDRYVKFPTFSKENRSYVVKGMKWVSDRDWEYSFYNHDKEKVFLPAGTEITLSSGKLRSDFNGRNCFGCVPDPVLNGFKEWDGEVLVPVNEAILYFKPVGDLPIKTYLKIEDDNGKPVVAKRYNTLANVKSSIRCRVRKDDDERPYYIDADAFDISNGLNAVEYDYHTDNVIQRRPMVNYQVMETLKG